MKFTFYISLFLLILLQGCRTNDRFKIDIDKLPTQTEFIRFDQDLMAFDSTDMAMHIDALQKRYPDFFELYTSRILRIGTREDIHFNDRLNTFLKDTIYLQVFDTVQHMFPDLSAINNSIDNGFKRYHYIFPDKTIPKVYYHLSGFNESVVVTSNLIAISLENYFGSKHPFYQWLSIYEYMRLNMYKEKIPSDALWSWIVTDFEDNHREENLLNKMLYNGKVLFLLEKLLPDEPIHRVLSYSPKQFLWCQENESSMWKYMIEQKHLFSKNQTIIKKYTSPGPFTNFFGTESAPRTGSFIGWKIISSFMENNTEVSLSELMQISDGQYLLEHSMYKP